MERLSRQIRNEYVVSYFSNHAQMTVVTTRCGLKSSLLAR
jgi:hypothetical protein